MTPGYVPAYALSSILQSINLVSSADGKLGERPRFDAKRGKRSSNQRCLEQDTDFDGNGPFMETYVQLRANGNAVEARVYLLAQEWNSALERPRADFTAFDGWSGWQEIASVPGRNIARILSPVQSIKKFVDKDHLLNVESGDALVREFRFVGDTDGGVLGADDRPSVRVVFNDIQVELA